MTSLQETILVNRSTADCFFYVSQFENIRDWDPGVAEAKKITPGKAQIGSEYEILVQFGLSKTPMVYRILELIPNKQIILEGKGENLTAIDTISFEQVSNASTRITYLADLTFTGIMEKLEGPMQGILKNVGIKAVNGLRRALDPEEIIQPEPSLLNKIGDALVLPGMLSFSSWGYSARKNKWAPITENLTGKTILVTGASTGLGRATARELARRGASLLVAARSIDKLESLKKEIANDSGNTNVQTFSVDLSDLNETRKLANQILKKEKSLHALVNNAGALFNEMKTTAQGNEMSLSLLLLSPFLLTELLYPLLKSSGRGRVINVSSGGMYTSAIKLDDLQFQKEKYNGSIAYARAKRGLVMISEVWAKRWAQDGILVNSMHPGWADTPGVESALPGFHKLTNFFLRTPEQGADSIIWLAASRQAEKLTGKFIFDREPHPTSILPGTAPSEQDYLTLEKKLRELVAL